MVVFLYFLIIIVVIIVVVQLLRHAIADSTRSGREDVSISMLQNQINASSEQTRQQMETLRQSVTDSIQNLASQVNQSLSSSHETVGNRLDATNRVIGMARERFTKNLWSERTGGEQPWLVACEEEQDSALDLAVIDDRQKITLRRGDAPPQVHALCRLAVVVLHVQAAAARPPACACRNGCSPRRRSCRKTPDPHPPRSPARRYWKA